VNDDARDPPTGRGLRLSALRVAFPLPESMAKVLWFVVFEVAYYLAFRYGASFGHALPSPFWFPDSILLCALLKSRPRNWWLFILGALPIRLFSPVAHEFPLWFLLGTFAIDFARSLLAAGFLRRFMHDPTRFDTIRDLIVFAAIAVVGAPALTAFGGAALRSMHGGDYWLSWQGWFLGDALAQVVITPAIFYWVFGAARLPRHVSIERIVEASVLFVGLIVTGYLATHLNGSSIYFTETVFYAPVPFLFWAAIRFCMPGATAGVAIVAFFAVEAALNGHGPFANRAPADVSFALQNFLLLRSAPLYVIAVAIGQERSAVRALRESEERFRKLADSAPVLIWMSGTDKLCDYFNRGWLEFTGRTMEQELGNGWAQGVHPDDFASCLQQYYAAFDARRPFEIDYRLRRRDGEYRWIIDMGVPRYGGDGEFAGYIGSAIDITDRKRAEDDHRALAHAQRLAVIGELTAALAHEIKQPLGAIALNAETLKLMLKTPDPQVEEMRRVVSDILSDVVRTDNVMNLIRKFVRNPETRLESIAPNELVADVLQLAGKDAARRGTEVRTELADGLPSVTGDRMQLQQVLLNLVMNAIEAMQSVPEPTRRLTLSTGTGPRGTVEISVADSGPGISEALKPFLFGSFFTTKPDGMGLGLSIAQSIARAHGGAVRLEEGVAGGAKFSLTLPIEQTDVTPPALSSGRSSSSLR
jgi:PAS domain S-box-containing protein